MWCLRRPSFPMVQRLMWWGGGWPGRGQRDAPRPRAAGRTHPWVCGGGGRVRRVMWWSRRAAAPPQRDGTAVRVVELGQPSAGRSAAGAEPPATASSAASQPVSVRPRQPPQPLLPLCRAPTRARVRPAPPRSRRRCGRPIFLSSAFRHARRSPCNFAEISIRRPVFATVLSLLVLLVIVGP